MHTILPPRPSVHSVSIIPVCVACNAFFACSGFRHCKTCREDAAKEAERIYAVINCFETRYGIGFGEQGVYVPEHLLYESATSFDADLGGVLDETATPAMTVYTSGDAGTMEYKKSFFDSDVDEGDGSIDCYMDDSEPRLHTMRAPYSNRDRDDMLVQNMVEELASDSKDWYGY